MIVMIDTNVFISAALFPNGTVACALKKALRQPYQPVTCEYVVDELHRKFQEKFPKKLVELEAFLYIALQSVHVMETPAVVYEEELKIRDLKDRPILRAAISGKVDLFLTGDKDFLESSVEDPRIISPADFLKMR